jgi:hypothetical protein
MLNPVAAGGLVVSLLAVMSGLTTTPTDEVTVPDGVAIEIVTVNGSGCPAGQGSATLFPDRSSFTITSPEYTASAGGTAGPTDFRTNCLVDIQIDRPQGWTYAVTEVHSAGFADLAPKVRGTSRVGLYFQGGASTRTASHPITGPTADNWQTTDVFDVASRVYAPCDAERNLNVNTELWVNLAKSDPAVRSLMARGAETGYRIAWKRCPPT